MTLAALLSDVYRRMNYANPPQSDVVARITGYVNETQQELASDRGLARLLRGSLTLTTTASVWQYALPPNVSTLLAVKDTAHRRRLIPQTEDWWQWVVPDPSTVTGTPQYYIPNGPRNVALQPSTADQVWVKSTSTSDTQTLNYEVIRTGGYIQGGQVTLTGTSAVQLGSLTDIISVSDWYLTGPAVGQVSLLQTSGTGTVLGTIGVGQTRQRYVWISFYPTPAAAYVYTLEHEIDASDLVQPNDEPAWLPPRFHRLLATGSRLREYEKTNSPRYAACLAEWARELGALKAYVTMLPDETIVPGRLKPGLSDLGAFFPAGTIWD